MPATAPITHGCRADQKNQQRRTRRVSRPVCLSDEQSAIQKRSRIGLPNWPTAEISGCDIDRETRADSVGRSRGRAESGPIEQVNKPRVVAQGLEIRIHLEPRKHAGPFLVDFFEPRKRPDRRRPDPDRSRPGLREKHTTSRPAGKTPAKVARRIPDRLRRFARGRC